MKMAVKLEKEIIELLNDSDSIKVLATTDKEGNPHVVFKNSLHVREDGYLVYWELIETSQTNKNMVNSIWFHKEVAITVRKGTVSYQIKGVPYRAIIAGHEFEEAYKQARNISKDTDLSTVWLIEPTQVIEETYEKRRNEEEKEHPILQHLDRLLENQ